MLNLHVPRQFALLGFFVLGTGCSLLSGLQNSGSERRTFSTKRVWIRPAPAKDIVGFRKINRMRPILFSEGQRDFVIQANSSDGVTAYDRKSGREIWRRAVLNGVESSIAIVKDRIFFGGNDGFFYSVDAKNGQVLWTFPTRIENLSEPLLHEGVVYFLNGANTLYALDAASGKQLWLYSRQDPNSLSIRGGSRPAIRGDTLFAGFSDGAVVALFVKNGAVKWEKQLNRNKRFRDLDSDPLVENEFLYLLGYDDASYCLRSATGEIVWKAEKGGYGSFLSVNDRLYFATTNNEFVALNKETGQRVWSHEFKEGVATAASLYKGLVVFGESQGSLRFVDARTWKIISSFDPGRGILAAPTVDEKNQSIFFISGESNLYHLEAGWGIQ